MYRLINGGRIESLSGRITRKDKSTALGRVLKYGIGNGVTVDGLMILNYF